MLQITGQNRVGVFDNVILLEENSSFVKFYAFVNLKTTNNKKSLWTLCLKKNVNI